MKSIQIRQSLIAAALVASVSFCVWYEVGNPAEPTHSHPASASVNSATASESLDASAADSIDDSTASAPEEPSRFAGMGKPIFPRLGNVSGRPIDLKGSAYMNAGITGEKIRGRSAAIDPSALASLKDVAEGDVVSIPGFDGELHGVVEVVNDEDTGWRRVGGPLEGDRSKGWFSFGYDGEHETGLVRMNLQKLAYVIEPSAGAGYQITERPLTDVVCLGLPAAAAAVAAPRVTAAAAAAAIVTPIVNSRPAATAQLFLDFDGEVVNDAEWGRITATPSPLTAAERVDVFRRVREDYLMFNINVTTDVAKYNAAKPGARMRCIITPVDTAAPGAGGVAVLNSFAYSGTIFTKDVPCWVFNPTVKSVADAISHEFGHTFALKHDGLVGRAEYYLGQGTGATSWGPIMGAPYTRNVSQWSKGEYPGANNYEDDITIIANDVNGFGYAPDDYGDTPATASPIAVSGSTIVQRGVIDKPNDRDVFYFDTKFGGTLLVTATGLENQVGDLDVQLDVLNSFGAVIGTNTFTNSLGAGLNVVVPAGRNYIRIEGAGDGDVHKTGYSSYGSHGAYTITGLLPP